MTPDSVDTYQINATLNTDIFVKNGDTILAEKINRRIKKILLAQKIPESADDGPIRCFPSNASGGQIPEDDPLIVRWNTEFLFIHYDKGVIEALNQ